MCKLVWGELGKFVNKSCVRRKHPLYMYYHLLFEAQTYSRKAICLCFVPGVVRDTATRRNATRRGQATLSGYMECGVFLTPKGK